MSQLIIRQLYEARLKAWAAARSPALLVGYENSPAPVTTGTFLRAFQLPAETDSADLAGAHRAYSGIFQVNVVSPINGGAGVANGIANEIAAQFTLNLRLTSGAVIVQIIKPSSVAQGLQDDTRYIVPVSFRYRSDVVT